MPRPIEPSESPDPVHDPLLAAVPTIEGYKVLGKTILLDVLGTGGMGVVYRGWHMTFHIDVAVKVLQASLAADRDYVRRFRREAQAALKITHQNVVRAYDVEELHGLHYFVMEFVDGESAWQRIGRLGRLAPAAALTVFAAAATGLAEAHAHGLVHRDVKPGNLLIARSGRVKLADLGLVHPAVDDDAPAGRGGDGSSRLLGTPQYLAPEQWDGAPAQPSADVWALGATLYYLVTGQHGLPRLPKAELRKLVREEPFPTLGGVLRSLPELNTIFERCVQRDPAARFQHAGELSQALLALGPGDEELLREGAPAASAIGRGLPPNEVLGRIDARLRGRPAPAAARPVAKPVTTAAVVTRRRQIEAQPRGGVNGIVIVVVLAVVAIVGSLLFLRSKGRGNDPPAATTEQRGDLERAASSSLDAPPPPPPPPPALPAGSPQQPMPEPPAVQPPANDPPPAVPPSAPPPVVEATSQDPPPVASSPRETLQAWLLHSGDASHVAWLVRHRDAFLLVRAQAGDDAQAVAAGLSPLDEAMQRYPDVAPGSVPSAAVDQLLTLAGAMRRQDASIEPLLPYLLLLQKNDPTDPGVAFCVFEAWAVEALDLQRARAAAADVQTLLATVVDSAAPSRARLPEVVFELGMLGDGGTAMLARVLRRVVAERLDGGALGVRGVRQAFVPELEAAYEQAMQAGDFDTAARNLQTLGVVDPADRAAEVLLAMVLGHRDGLTFDHATLAPEQQLAITERARHLGFQLLAPQGDIPGVLASLGNAASAQLPFFAVGLHADVKDKQAVVEQLTQDIRTTQDQERKLRAKAENETQRSANNRQRNPAVSEQARAEAKRLYAEAAAANAKVQQLRKDQEQAKRDLRRLDAELRELERQRSEFRLQ